MAERSMRKNRLRIERLPAEALANQVRHLDEEGAAVAAETLFEIAR